MDLLVVSCGQGSQDKTGMWNRKDYLLALKNQVTLNAHSPKTIWSVNKVETVLMYTNFEEKLEEYESPVNNIPRTVLGYVRLK